MIRIITKENCITRENVRTFALRECVLNAADLLKEFYTNYPKSWMKSGTWNESMNHFIKNRGIRIIKETPSVIVNDKGLYQVNVRFEVEY